MNNDRAISEMVKCSVCGKPAIMRKHLYHGIRYYVECSDDKCIRYLSFTTEKEAIRKWRKINRRR